MGHEVPQDEHSIRVVVAKDGRAAELVIPEECPRELITFEICTQLLRGAGVEVNREVECAVQNVVDQAPPPGTAVEVVVARAAEPKPGSDGSLEWLIESETPESDESEKEFSFYACCSYTMVNKGQIVGRVTAPTAGEDGRDVRGETIPARAGRPVELKLDESISQDRNGQLVAQADGVLIQSRDAARISTLLEVPEYVDFSTGNIDFEGDVIVRKGVRDCFLVKATGNVEVCGLIEAATIECTGNLIARGGMAGRERGHVQVGGDVLARYLDNIHGEMKGDLKVEREAINCDLAVAGAVRSPGGAIIGGRIVVTGAVEVGSIGSAAAVRTVLVVGTVPTLEATSAKFEHVLEQLDGMREKLMEEQMHIGGRGRLQTDTDKERLTEIMFELQEVERNLGRVTATRRTLDRKIEERRTVDITIGRRLFPGVMITVRDRSFCVDEELRGPLTISVARGGDVVFRRGTSDPRLFTGVAHLVTSAAA